MHFFSLYTHTLGGVDWAPPPRGPHWDLLANYTHSIETLSNITEHKYTNS